MFEDSGIQHEMRFRHIVICGLPHSAVRFPHYITNCTIFGGGEEGGREGGIIDHKMCVWSFSTTFFRNIYFFKEELSELLSAMYTDLRVKYRLFSSDFNETCTFSIDLKKNTQI